jgi:hypothetical protein
VWGVGCGGIERKLEFWVESFVKKKDVFLALCVSKYSVIVFNPTFFNVGHYTPHPTTPVASSRETRPRRWLPYTLLNQIILVT